MQQYGCMCLRMDVYRALADETRRDLLDALREEGGQTLGALAADMPMTRQAVAKHLAILEDANLVAVRWQGREKLHYLNPVPIAEIVRRWVGRFEELRLDALGDFKDQIEAEEKRRA